VAGPLRRWRDRLVASDPGLARFRTGAWALLTAAASSALLLFAARVLGVSSKIALMGAVVALMSTITVQDATRSAQQRTLAASALVSAAAVILGAALSGSTLATGAFFLAIVVAAFEVRRFGARGTALGTSAYQSYFYALLLQPEAQHWPWLLASVVVGCAIAWLVRFVLLPERPAGVLRSELRALRAGVAELLQELAGWMAAADRARHERRARATLARINDLSLRIDQRLVRFTDQEHPAAMQSLRDRLLRAELAAETLLACASEAVDACRPGRDALASALCALCDIVHGDARFDAQAWQAQVAECSDALDADQRWRCERAGAALGHEPPWAASLPELRDTTVPAAPPQKPRPAQQDRRWRWLSDEPTRQAVQAGCAASVAMLAGYAISSDHWYWAVFGAFIIFTRASTRGQAVAGAWRRLLGDVAGLALGLLLAELAHGSKPLQLALLFAFIAVGFYAFQGLQPVYIALLTAMLAMLYELLGKYTPGLLVLRMGETLAGAAAAVLSAQFVLPSHTSDQSDQESLALLHEAARLLRSAFDGPGRRSPTDAVRDLDRRLQALRQALGPVTGPGLPASRTEHRDRLQQMGVLVHCIRHFYNLLALEGGAWRDREGLAARAQAVAANIERVADALAGQDGSAAMQELPAAAAASDDSPHPARIAAHWLDEANETLASIREPGRAAAEKPTRR
jgi:uncharacterized membrane protein YccC